jgi:hypothetical protein
MDTSINERVNLPPARRPQEKNEVNLVSVHVRDLLNLRRLQGRLSVRQTAALLNCGEHDIPVLVQQGLLTPLGNPPPSAQKYFSPVEVLEMAGDAQKMGQICDVLYRYWKKKNAAKTKRTPAQNVPANGNGNRSKRLRQN